MLYWIELPTIFAVRFMWSAARNALQDCFVAITVAMAFLGAFCALLGILALEGLMAHLLAIVALCRSWLMFKGAGYTRFSPSMEEPISKEPPRVHAFG